MAITLNSVVYNWAGFDPSGTSRWAATAAGVASAFSNLTARVTIGAAIGKDLRPSRAKWRIQIPVIATEDSDCACVGTVLRTAYADVILDFHATATLAERQDMLARVTALVATSQFIDSVNNLNQPAG
jgi:hypothetical protein